MSSRAIVFVAVASACGPTTGGNDDMSGSTSSVGESSTTRAEFDPSTGTTAPADTTSDPTGTGTNSSSTEGTSSGTTGEACTSPFAGLTMLTCGEVQSKLAVDDDFVFAVLDGHLVRVPLAGGGVELLVEDSHASALLRHGSLLYWVDFVAGEVGRVDLESGDTATLTRGLGHVHSLAADEDWVYVSEYEDDGTVLRIPSAGGAAEPLYTGLDYPGPIVRVGAELFVVDSNNDGNDGTPILRGSTDGVPLVDFIEAVGVVNALLVHDDRLFWAAYSSSSGVRAIDLAPGSIRELIAPSEGQPMGLAIANGRAWWTEIGDMAESYSLHSIGLVDGSMTEDEIVDPMRMGHLITTPFGVVLEMEIGIALIDETSPN